MKVLAALLALAGVAAANSPFRFSDGYLDVLGAEPVQAFDCAGRSYGYYADVSSDCRVFHVCLPVADDLGELLETAHFSFFCGNQTVFSQESLTCAHPEEAFPCDQAETLFDSVNALFGVIPDEK
ncbi:U-scoloptoxin(01)-Cw1a-like [Penaeus chinensis]|uniref:U-scoloptoxin(01)-Cw1a-like n=1 Tax=Penaeus chinensis TaxID=139456 RepID=UPI001FB5D6E0|nr:U-scoloptoxin(01)-Cw1a-like [Penaeus chinensis]